MKMTLKNKYTMKIKKMYKEAEKLGYVPNNIEVSQDELRGLVNELCVFKANNRYALAYKDATDEGSTSSLASVFLQHRPNEVSDMIIAGTANLIYRDDIDFIIIKDKAPEVLMEEAKD